MSRQAGKRDQLSVREERVDERSPPQRDALSHEGRLDDEMVVVERQVVLALGPRAILLGDEIVPRQPPARPGRVEVKEGRLIQSADSATCLPCRSAGAQTGTTTSGKRGVATQSAQWPGPKNTATSTRASEKLTSSCEVRTWTERPETLAEFAEPRHQPPCREAEVGRDRQRFFVDRFEPRDSLADDREAVANGAMETFALRRARRRGAGAETAASRSPPRGLKLTHGRLGRAELLRGGAEAQMAADRLEDREGLKEGARRCLAIRGTYTRLACRAFTRGTDTGMIPRIHRRTQQTVHRAHDKKKRSQSPSLHGGSADAGGAFRLRPRSRGRRTSTRSPNEA